MKNPQKREEFVYFKHTKPEKDEKSGQQKRVIPASSFPSCRLRPKKQAMQPIDGKISRELRVRFGFTVFPFFSESDGDDG